VDLAACGLDALQDAATAFPDLAFVNINLPDMSGLEVIRRLKRLIPAPEVVALLTDNHSEFRIAAATWGADGCIARAEFFHLAEDFLPRLRVVGEDG
jgi:DNA-binding NarL/FixJ family response regulator